MKNNIQTTGTRSPPFSWRRAFVWLLLICFTVSSAIPARADQDTTLLELLDYGYIQHPDHFVSGNRTEIIDTDETVFYKLPYGMTMNYIDMLIYASSSVSPIISAGLDAWGYYTLSIQQLSSNMWRVYGSIPEHTYTQIEICFSSSSTSGYVNFYSCKVGFTGENIGSLSAGVSTPFSSSSNWTGDRPFYSSGYSDGPARAYLTIYDWQGYDFVYINCEFAVEGITSIYANISTIPVPFTVSYLEAIPSESARYRFNITLDLRGIERSSRNNLIVEILCDTTSDLQTTSTMNIHYASGIASVRYIEPEIYWLQEIRNALLGDNGIPFLHYINSSIEAMAGVVGNIYVRVGDIFTYLETTLIDAIQAVISRLRTIQTTLQSMYSDLGGWFENLFSILSPNTSESDDVKDDLATQATELDELTQELDKVEKPDIDEMDTDLDSILPGAEVSQAAAPLAVVLTSESFAPVMLVSLLFMLGSYVLYGKR